MKRVIVSVLSIIVVLAAVFVSTKYFRAESSFYGRQRMSQEMENNEPK